MVDWESRSDRLKRVRSEIARLTAQIAEAKRGSQTYALLYTAREALVWALDGVGKQGPCDAILTWGKPWNQKGKVDG